MENYSPRLHGPRLRRAAAALEYTTPENEQYVNLPPQGNQVTPDREPLREITLDGTGKREESATQNSVAQEQARTSEPNTNQETVPTTEEAQNGRPVGSLCAPRYL